MVIVRNIESDTVEEAYLFIREDAPMPDESELVREAGRIIRACGSTGKKGLRIPSAVFGFRSESLLRFFLPRQCIIFCFDIFIRRLTVLCIL